MAYVSDTAPFRDILFEHEFIGQPPPPGERCRRRRGDACGPCATAWCACARAPTWSSTTPCSPPEDYRAACRTAGTRALRRDRDRREAGARPLALYHHAPERSDDEVDGMLSERPRRWPPARASGLSGSIGRLRGAGPADAGAEPLMEVTFWGVRGSIPAPGPGTIRYGGNTSCVLVRTGDGDLVGPRLRHRRAHLGLAQLRRPGRLSAGGRGSATSCSRTPTGTTSRASRSSARFTSPATASQSTAAPTAPALLEGDARKGRWQPSTSRCRRLKNMGASIEIAAVARAGETFDVLGCTRHARAPIPHGRHGASPSASRTAGPVLVYASDAGYGPDGPSAEALALYAGRRPADPRRTYTPEDRARYPQRGLPRSSDAVEPRRSGRGPPAGAVPLRPGLQPTHDVDRPGGRAAAATSASSGTATAVAAA